MVKEEKYTVEAIKSRRLKRIHVARMEGDMSAFKIITGTPIVNGHLGRPGHKWDDNM